MGCRVERKVWRGGSEDDPKDCRRKYGRLLVLEAVHAHCVKEDQGDTRLHKPRLTTFLMYLRVSSETMNQVFS